jgi:amino acid adenylation domain-containing protein
MAFLLHQLLSESASQYPGRPALVFRDRTMAYAELEQESNRIAHLLLNLKIQKGDRVGLFFDRGMESIIAGCGVLKTGGIYVPIDPASPSRRVGFIIKKCGIKLLLTTRNKLDKLQAAFPGELAVEHIILIGGGAAGSSSLRSVPLIDAFSCSKELPESAPAVQIVDSDIAYILFTSGSTGNPKGVMISHRNSLSFVNSANEFFKIIKEDRFSNVAPLHFDMSIFDIFVAFKGASCVVIIPEPVAIFPAKLAEYISEKNISVWNSVPSALSLLATYNKLSVCDMSNLRLILFAGELFPLKYLRLLKESIPGARFCNMYGQTEANSSTSYWVDQLPSDDKTPLPIGKALPNYEVFALDENGNRIARCGQEGELYVRGSAVARGYWGESELTEKAFVRSPIHTESNERVYRTGDLVRLDPNGDYIFFGRKDHMIKSRGYRIEIGEIEAVLSNHPDIKCAVVVPVPDDLIGNRLSVIVVPSEPGKISKEDILRYCSGQLPKYMVPEIVEFSESLPMTSSGKVDRQTLKPL